MKKNLNDKVVVLDKDVYARLAELAGIGAYEISREVEFKQLTRHARKFNPDLRPAHALVVQEQEQKRAEERRQNFRARRMVSNRNGVHYGQDVNGTATVEKYKREFFLLNHKKEAFPIYIVGFAPNYGKSGIKIEYLDPKHKEMNFYGCETTAKHIVESAEEIPVNYKRYYPNVDLRTGNECCADPCLTFDGTCENCGHIEQCCENEDRDNWGGTCKNCGDPCL